MERESLLFLAHRLPYPPNKGDKIRSFQWLSRLSETYRIFLGTFVDDPADHRFAHEVAGYCEDCCIRPLHRLSVASRALGAYARKRPLTVGCYADPVLQNWVNGLLSRGQIRAALVFSSAMVQFVAPAAGKSCEVVADFVDVDSDKWRQYSLRRKWPMSYVFRRESRLLLRYEREVARDCASVLFVTQREAQLFAQLAPEVASRVRSIENGVDVARFSPTFAYENPYPPHGAVLVFTGVMDYWANVDAVNWFARDVFPRVRARVPDALFYVVGARPAPAVLSLAKKEGIVVTGTVADVRPYIAHARGAVIPLRVARGIQNKILEAFALACPVVATSAALDSLDLPVTLEACRADDAHAFADRCVQLLVGCSDLGPVARRFVLDRYRWEDKVDALTSLLDQATTTAKERAA